MDLKQHVLDQAKQHHDSMVAVREHLHAHPELSNEEEKTAAYIVDQLKDLGVDEIQTGIAGHGVVATIHGKGVGSKVIGVRPDMDALPILEANDVPYKSQNEGVMHACGHDVHMTCSLGAARILINLSEHWGGTVRLFFQPSEERLPGGALGLLDAGVIQEPKLDALFALHVFPEMEAGGVGFRGGAYMASSDEIYITIHGKGGHAALPQNNIDPIQIAAKVITELHAAIKQQQPEEVPTVFAIGKVEAEGATNIIPNEVRLSGTFRTMNEEWREHAKVLLTEVAERISNGDGGSASVKIVTGTPVLVNDESVTRSSMEAAAELIGEEVVEALPLRMSSDDFAFFSEHAPCCYFRLGVGNKEKGITSVVHTDTFDIDNKALETGPAVMAWVMLNQLTK
jgi:amidohydrolase